MPIRMNHLVTLENHQLDLPDLPRYLAYQNITNDRLVALSFDLSGPSNTRLDLTYTQDSMAPFSGLIKPRYQHELASWVPVESVVFLETVEPLPDGYSSTLCAVKDKLCCIRTWDKQKDASLYLTARFFRRHSQYILTPHRLICAYRPGHTGISSIRPVVSMGILVGIQMDGQGRAEAILRMELDVACRYPDHIGSRSSWTEWFKLNSGQLAPFFSRPFGSRKRPEYILNLGSDDRIHLGLWSKTRISNPMTFQLKERVVGSPPVPNADTCLIYHADSKSIEVENVLVTGSGNYANCLSCTVRK